MSQDRQGGHRGKDGPDIVPRAIEPGSMLWRYAGDRRLSFSGLSAGLLQLMHPGIGAGVAQHSNFFDDPWDRIIRSIPQILGVVYDPDAEAIGHRVRDYHRTIKGTDHLGRRYHALDPATFWWAHATFQFSAEMVADRFDARRLTRQQREELYRDGIEWYRRYGVSMRPVPPTRDAFGREWDRHLAEVLEMTPAAERALEMALSHRPLQMSFLPGWTRLFQPFLITPVLQLTAIGGLPAPVRARFDIPWRIDEEIEYRVFQLAVREAWRNMPARLRFGPVAAAGFRARRQAERDAATLLGVA